MLTTGAMKERHGGPQQFSFSFRKLWTYTGPAFLVSIAYIDPGNLATDLQAGTEFKYDLLWVLFWATTMGLLLQTLAYRLGLVTGRDLARCIRDEYPRPVVVCLWLLTESAIIASDIPEVIGTAFALRLLFNMPLWVGVIVTCFGTLLFLGIQLFGVRKLEALVSALIATMSVCFFIEMFMSKPSVKFLAEGTVIPRISQDSLFVAISLVGAVVMPHNLFLHSALVQTRDIDRSDPLQMQEANVYFFAEACVALFLSFLVNMSVVAVAAAKFSSETQDVSLQSAYSLLGDVLHSSIAPMFWAVGLLASGQSSAITGTYAGQFVMQGFMDINVSPWLRNLVTRSVAIVPSLFVALYFGEAGSNDLIILSSVVLSFQLPFALIPLLKFNSSSGIMGNYTSGRTVRVVTWTLGFFLIAANTWLVSCFLWPYVSVLTGLALYIAAGVLALVAVPYFGLVFYMCVRPVRSAVHVAVKPPPVFFDPERQPLLISVIDDDDSLDVCAA